MSKEYTPFKMKGFPQQVGVSPAKHLGHTPWTKSDHTVVDHAKAFVKDPIGTTKKVVKQTLTKIKKGKNPLK